MTRTLHPLLGLLAAALIAVACSSTGSATGAPGSSAPSTPPSGAPTGTPSADPDGSTEPGGGAGVPGVGIIDSELVQPQPGQQNVVSIPIEQLEATVDGRTVTLLARWSSGVAPCSVLDQVLVDVGDGTIDVTIREGTSDPDAMCVMMLQAKHTIVSFEVEPGRYTVRDTEGQAPSIEIVVS